MTATNEAFTPLRHTSLAISDGHRYHMQQQAADNVMNDSNLLVGTACDSSAGGFLIR